jgi:hypothetical protein
MQVSVEPGIRAAKRAASGPAQAEIRANERRDRECFFCKIEVSRLLPLPVAMVVIKVAKNH